MRKMAVFVEGLTEAIFLERFIIEIGVQGGVRFERFGVTGNRSSRYINKLRSDANWGQTFEVYIFTSNNDSRAISDLLDNYLDLLKKDYCVIMSIADVRPHRKREDLDDIVRKLKDMVITADPSKSEHPTLMPDFVFAVMEIEAWFLAEHTHFQKLHPDLTLDRIRAEFDFDPSNTNMELRNNPSSDLQSVYKLEGIRYAKHESEIRRTVNALNCEDMYLTLSQRMPSFGGLVDAIDRFLT